MTTIITKDTLRASVEAATGGKVTVLYDDLGMPSYMCVIPAFNCEDIDPSLGTGLHPAFIKNGVEKSEIFIAQYLAAVQDGRAISLPSMDARTSVNFDVAKSYCTAKGPGWHLMTNWEWAAIAHWCLKNGFQPRGNTNYGRHHELTYETGRRQDGGTPGDTAIMASTLSGSGPVSWRHDKSVTGISDLVGNVHEWQDGMKMVDGQFFMPSDNDFDLDEESWTGQGVIMAEDTGIKLGTTADTLVAGGSKALGAWKALTTTAAYDALSATTRERMVQACIAPYNATDPMGDYYFDTEGERRPRRGGYWINGPRAGLFVLGLSYTSASSYTHLGFRPAFIA